MDGPIIAATSHKMKSPQRLKPADEGENLNPAAERKADPSPSQIIGKYVCSSAWSPASYPPRANCAATAMRRCEGRCCGAKRNLKGGRIYPFYYVALVEVRAGDELTRLCFDCWQIVLWERARQLDAWYAEDHGTTESPSAAIIDMARQENLEIVELRLEPDDEASLRVEIEAATAIP